MKPDNVIYRAEQFPIFQNRMFHAEVAARNCARGDILLTLDKATGLIANRAFRPELMGYDADYQNEQAVSAVFRRHLENVFRIIQRHFQGNSLIEVGCGKGHFLEQLQGLGFSITGMDPAYEGTNPSVIKKYFSPEVGMRADAIILRHVLEHVPNPVGFLATIRDTNGGGKVYLEVPCFDWICRRRAWFDIFYEHVNYFRMADFHRMFERVYEAGHTFNGQYLYVVADLSTVRMPVYNQTDRVEWPEDFLDSVEQYAARVRMQNTGWKASSAIWGGASKGVIFALLMERAGAKIELVIDLNPAKQGKFLAATGLQVRSYDEALRKLAPGADLFVMNSNYLEEIRELTANQFNYIAVEYDGIS